MTFENFSISFPEFSHLSDGGNSNSYIIDYWKGLVRPISRKHTDLKTIYFRYSYGMDSTAVETSMGIFLLRAEREIIFFHFCFFA